MRTLWKLAAVGLALDLACTVAWSDEIDDHIKSLKRTDYGSLWDKVDATKALGTDNSVRAVDALMIAAADDMPAVREAAALALARIRDDAARKVIYLHATKDKNALVREVMVWSMRLDKDKSEDAIKVYLAALVELSADVRAQAARAVSALGIKAAGDIVMKRLRDVDPDTAAEMALAAASLGLAEAVEPLAKIAAMGPVLARAGAIEALATLDPAKFGEVVERATKDSSPEVRMGAGYGLLALAATPDAAFDHAVRLVGDKDWRVRVGGLEVLVAIRQERCVTPIIEQFAKEKGRLRYDMGEALEDLTGRELGHDVKPWKAWWDAAGAEFKLPPKAKKGKKKVAKGDAAEDGSIAKFFGIPIFSQGVVFCVDFSGSMRNELTKGSFAQADKKATKLEVAMDQLEQALGALAPDQRFSGVNLSTEALAQKKPFLSKTLLAASRSTKAQALEVFKDVDRTLAKIQRGRGDFYDSLVQGANEIDGMDTYMLISDGKPTDGQFVDRENFLPEWTRFNKYRRLMLHTILVGGSSFDRNFMRDLAEGTGGVFLDATGEDKDDDKPRRDGDKKDCAKKDGANK